MVIKGVKNMQWEEVIPKLKPLNGEYIMQAQERLDQLTKPKGSLGQLEQLAMQLSAIYQSIYFSVRFFIVANRCLACRWLDGCF